MGNFIFCAVHTFLSFLNALPKFFGAIFPWLYFLNFLWFLYFYSLHSFFFFFHLIDFFSLILINFSFCSYRHFFITYLFPLHILSIIFMDLQEKNLKKFVLTKVTSRHLLVQSPDMETPEQCMNYVQNLQ